MIAQTNQYWRAFYRETDWSTNEWVAEWNRVTRTKIFIIKLGKGEGKL